MHVTYDLFLPFGVGTPGDISIAGIFLFFSFLSFFLSFFLFFFFFFGLLGLQQHMEFPRLGVQSELQLPTYTKATAMPDPSGIFDLHHNSGQL